MDSGQTGNDEAAPTGTNRTIVKTKCDLGGYKMKLFKFKKDESGAVTVDWVVLTAALVLVGGVVVTAVRGGMQNLAEKIDTELSGQSVS